MANQRMNMPHQRQHHISGSRVVSLTRSAASAEQRAADLRLTYGVVDGLALLTPMIEEEFCGRIALTSSFGAEAAILLDMVARIDPKTPVIFIDTGKLFEETYNYFATLTGHFGLGNIQRLQPDSADLRQSDPQGDLWSRDPDACCSLRKIAPLAPALEKYDAWITGRKRFHGALRQNLETIESVDGRVKINPLAGWSQERVAQYFTENKLPVHPLVAQGYSSIGCHHCTHRAEEGENVRSGRWIDSNKTECGIHRARWAQ